MRIARMVAVIGSLSLAVGMVALAESRGRHYTPAELLEQSTLVFKGRVLEVETLDEYKVSFPTKAAVDQVLKGNWGHTEIKCKHKSPGKDVIYEEEFNKPEKGQTGTFYLQAQYEYVILIGYIKETEPEPAAVLAAMRLAASAGTNDFIWTVGTEPDGSLIQQVEWLFHDQDLTKTNCPIWAGTPLTIMEEVKDRVKVKCDKTALPPDKRWKQAILEDGTVVGWLPRHALVKVPVSEWKKAGGNAQPTSAGDSGTLCQVQDEPTIATKFAQLCDSFRAPGNGFQDRLAQLIPKGTPVSRFKTLLSLANKVERKNESTIYTFDRGGALHGGQGLMVFVYVDTSTQKITSVLLGVAGE